MKKNFLFCCFIFSTILTAQTKFEEGYYITNSGEKIVGYIKNLDWKNNPTDIEFKKNLDSEVVNLEKEIFSEFGIDNILKYKKFNIQVEKSSNKLINMQNSETPIFFNETVFLKVLVEGKKSLYVYKDIGLIKYFYMDNVTDENPKQLINIEYNENSIIKKNEQYKIQLFKDVNCNVDRNAIQKLNYTDASLKKYFLNYNECSGEKFQTFTSKRTEYNLKAEIKSNFYNYTFETNNINSSREFGIGFGLEFEAILPFNNQKFSFILNPTYNNFDSSFTTLSKNNLFSSNKQVNIKTNNLNIPIGLRYYMHLNNNSRLFLTPTVNLNYSFSNSDGLYLNNNLFSKFDQSINLGVGFGFAYKKFFLEAKLNSNMSLFENTAKSDEKNVISIYSLSLKYQLF